jgi:hypothetical protein
LIESSQVVSGSLSHPTGTLQTSGNRLEGARVFMSRPPAQQFGATGADVWMSWLQVRDRDVSGWQGIRLDSPLGPGNQNYFIGEPSAGPANGFYGIGQVGDDAGLVSSGVPFQPGVPVFMVVQFSFRDGNDVATLYVNPTPGDASPTGGVSFTGVDMRPGVPTLMLQGLLADTPVRHGFDELRIGTTYGEVAPLVPEPASGAVAILLALFTASRRPRLPVRAAPA